MAFSSLGSQSESELNYWVHWVFVKTFRILSFAVIIAVLDRSVWTQAEILSWEFYDFAPPVYYSDWFTLSAIKNTLIFNDLSVLRFKWFVLLYGNKKVWHIKFISAAVQPTDGPTDTFFRRANDLVEHLHESFCMRIIRVLRKNQFCGIINHFFLHTWTPHLLSYPTIALLSGSRLSFFLSLSLSHLNVLALIVLIV